MCCALGPTPHEERGHYVLQIRANKNTNGDRKTGRARALQMELRSSLAGAEPFLRMVCGQEALTQDRPRQVLVTPARQREEMAQPAAPRPTLASLKLE